MYGRVGENRGLFQWELKVDVGYNILLTYLGLLEEEMVNENPAAVYIAKKVYQSCINQGIYDDHLASELTSHQFHWTDWSILIK